MRTTEPLKWDQAIDLIIQLKEKKRYQHALLILLGIFTGFRISDILSISLADLRKAISEEGNFLLTEKKTRKKRKIKICDWAKEHARECLSGMKIRPSQKVVFISQRGPTAGNRLSVDGANYRIDRIFTEYGIQTENNSCHTLRKTFARNKVDILWEELGDFSLALHIVSKDMNHSSVQMTMDYVGYTSEYRGFSETMMQV